MDEVSKMKGWSALVHGRWFSLQRYFLRMILCEPLTKGFLNPFGDRRVTSSLIICNTSMPV